MDDLEHYMTKCGELSRELDTLKELVGECIEEIESRDMDNWGYVEIYAKKLLPKLKQAVEEG